MSDSYRDIDDVIDLIKRMVKEEPSLKQSVIIERAASITDWQESIIRMKLDWPIEIEGPCDNLKQTITPCGTKVLVKILPVEEKSSGGIIIESNVSKKREQDARDLGVIISMGPLAYRGYKACLDLKGPKDWGVKIGDTVEFRRFDGKRPRPDEYCDDYRYIDDEDVISVITDNK